MEYLRKLCNRFDKFNYIIICNLFKMSDKKNIEQLMWPEDKPKWFPKAIWNKLSDEVKSAVVTVLSADSKKQAKIEYIIDHFWGVLHGINKKGKVIKWTIPAIEVNIESLIGKEVTVFKTVNVINALFLNSKEAPKDSGIGINTLEQYGRIENISYDNSEYIVKTQEPEFNTQVWEKAKDKKSDQRWAKMKEVSRKKRRDIITFDYISPKWDKTSVEWISLTQFSSILSAALHTNPRVRVEKH